jgi:hypothetical protein
MHRGVRRMVRSVLVIAAAVLDALPAMACTLCHSRTAQDVRTAIFGPDFWSNVVAISTVIPVLVIAVLAVRRFSP